MNLFPDKLTFEDAGMRGDTRLFRLTREFRYISSYGVIRVPALFVTDGASIPKMFHTVMGPFGSYFQAAVIHDYLYSEDNFHFDRFESDDIFNEAMFNSGVPWLTRNIVHRAVRLAGWRFFKGRAKL